RSRIQYPGIAKPGDFPEFKLRHSDGGCCCSPRNNAEEEKSEARSVEFFRFWRKLFFTYYFESRMKKVFINGLSAIGAQPVFEGFAPEEFVLNTDETAFNPDQPSYKELIAPGAIRR